MLFNGYVYIEQKNYNYMYNGFNFLTSKMLRDILKDSTESFESKEVKHHGGKAH